MGERVGAPLDGSTDGSGEIRPKHGSPKLGFALISDLNCNKSEKRIEIKIPSLIRTAKSPIRQGSGNAYFI